MNHFQRISAAVALGTAFALPTASAQAFVTFESGQVRPLAKSPDGSLLFVCNTPDNRLEIFDISGGGFAYLTSVAVGLEPVAVAAPTNDEVWVVNHLSDSVSIVDVSNIAAPRVTRSLNVGDEPRDIVFGGTAFDLAFITTAHRGQNAPFDPQFTTAGVGRSDVWVFDSGNLGSSFGGDAETIIQLFGDTPRPLAVSPDGSRVYAGVFMSGNETTVLGEGVVPNGGVGSGGLPNPATDHTGAPRPEVGLIVKYDGTKWTDELNRDWNTSVKFNLPDYDVFAIDATMDPPVQLAGTPGRFAHVGTTLFNMAVNPASEKLFVSNLEAFNEVRFEGPGIFASTTVIGHIVESRITVIDPVLETVTPRHLNKHINYSSPFDPAPNATNAKSLAFPLEMAFSGDGATLFVSAFGSSKVGVYSTSEIETDTFTPDVADQISVTGGGPTGLVLDEANSRLFVLTRFDNSVSVLNTSINVETAHVALHNPEPRSVVEGRPFLYDAAFTSSRGDQACASCHLFGDMDALAWDLGNPDDETLNNPQSFLIGPFGNPDFHPMKGPMTTQSLRGMDNAGPMHWRGDRTGGNDDLVQQQPNRGVFNEQAAFKKFNGAFVGLIGRSAELADEEMGKFTDFILQVMYPPNPVRSLDNALTPGQTVARGIYFNRITDTFLTCNGCHVHNRNGNAGLVDRPGFFGADGRSSFENETQHMKIAHLRNVYQKVGMFGMAAEPFVNPGDNGHKGDQIRGFGFLHDGSLDTVFRFFHATVFNASGMTGFQNDTERRQMENLMFAFDTNHLPIVGQQATLSPTSGIDADTRVDLLLNQADAGACDVIVKGIVSSEPRGYLYEGDGSFETDRAKDNSVTETALRDLALVAGQDLTFTAVPVGEGRRIGLDLDGDGFLDGDELDAGTNPGSQLILACDTTEPGFVFKQAKLLGKKGRLQISGDVTLAVPYAGETVGVDARDNGGPIFSAGADGTQFSMNSSGTSFKYKAPRGVAGISGVNIKALKTPGQYRVSVKTSAAWNPGGAGETPATTGVTLHVGGECFEGLATQVR